MLRFFMSELKRMLTSKYLLFGFVVSSIGLSIDLARNLLLYFRGVDEYVPFFEKWVGLCYENIGSLIFYWLLPVSVAVPFAWTMRDEMNSGYTSQILTRVKKGSYFLTKLLVSFISGAVIGAGSLLGSMWLHSFFLRAIYPQPNDMRTSIFPKSFLSTLYYDNPYLYVLIWTMIAALWCGAVAALCYALSFFIRKKPLVIISAQIIFIIQNITQSNNYGDDYAPWIDFVHVVGISDKTIVFKTIAVLLIIEILVTVIMGKRYENV